MERIAHLVVTCIGHVVLLILNRDWMHKCFDEFPTLLRLGKVLVYSISRFRDNAIAEVMIKHTIRLCRTNTIVIGIYHYISMKANQPWAHLTTRVAKERKFLFKLVRNELNRWHRWDRHVKHQNHKILQSNIMNRPDIRCTNETYPKITSVEIIINCRSVCSAKQSKTLHSSLWTPLLN